MSVTFEGGCSCGAIRYRIAGEPLARSLCHCRSCRLAVGASPVAWLVVQRQDLSFTTGQPIHYRSSPNVERGFCSVCGTSLTYQDAASPGTIDITASTLDHQEYFVPTREVWVEHRPSWLPAVPRLAQFPDSSQGR